MPKPDLFCFFSGFAHRDVELIEHAQDSTLKIIELRCINRGKYALLAGDHIQLDGVLFQVTQSKQSSPKQPATFTAVTTVELAHETSIATASPGDKLALGILAEQDFEHTDLWMLQPSAAQVVTYQKCSVLAGHEHTLKLDFTAPISLAASIQENRHLGLSGSSLTAREVSYSESRVFFSIYCGRETREKTQFNSKLPSGSTVNFTEAGEIYHAC